MSPHGRFASSVVVVLALAGAGCGSALAPTNLTNGSARMDSSEWALANDSAPLPDPSAPFGENLPPSVAITSPRPSPLLNAIVPPQFSVHWTAEDPDGPAPFPKSYRYQVIREDDPLFTVAIQFPDTLRRLNAPRFEAWTAVSGRAEQVLLQDLAINYQYVFVITAIDHRGAYDPVFSLSKNMLRFSVSPVVGADGMLAGGPVGSAPGSDGGPPAKEGVIRR